MKNLEYKSLEFKVESTKQTGDRLNVKGYAAIFGNVDSWGDVIEPGAFIETLAKSGKRVKLLFNHNFDFVVGKINEIREDAKGLFVDFDILPTSMGKDLIILVDGGALDEMSIGYRTVEFKDERTNNVDIRRLLKINLYETSIVTRAANDQATFDSTQRKSEQVAADLTAMTEVELSELKSAVDQEYQRRVFNHLNK